MTRREIWMLTGIGFNTVASLTAIALWALAPPRSAPLKCPPSAAVIAAPPLLVQQASPPERPTGLRNRITAPTDKEAAAQDSERSALSLQRPTEKTEAPASVVALGERLHLAPEVLSQKLGDAHGELPQPSIDRLERGYKTGEALARRLDLDEGRTQSLTALLTYYVFSELREEKAAPGGVDPDRREALIESLLNDLRVTCGEDVVTAVKSEIEGL